MEHGRPLQSFATSDSRVSSPSAAKTGAFASRWAAILLRFLGDMALDVLHLLCPTAVIHAKRFEAAVAGDFVEAGFCDQRGSGSAATFWLHVRTGLGREVTSALGRAELAVDAGVMKRPSCEAPSAPELGLSSIRGHPRWSPPQTRPAW